MWELVGRGRIKYIINKQVGGAHSLMKNEAFRVNSRKDIGKEEVKVWVGGKGGGGGCSRTIFNEKIHYWQEEAMNKGSARMGEGKEGVQKENADDL